MEWARETKKTHKFGEETSLEATTWKIKKMFKCIRWWFADLALSNWSLG